MLKKIFKKYLKNIFCINIEIFTIGNDVNDTPIFELANQAFLLKKQGAWQQIHADNLNMINASNAKGLKICFSDLGINN